METSYIPKGIRYVAERLSGMARNRVRLESQGASSVNAGMIISFQLPEGIIDLKSFKMHGRVTTTESKSADNNHKIFGKIPADAASLISRIEVQANGQQLTHACSEFNTVSKILKLVKPSHAHDHSVDRMLAHSEHAFNKAVDDVTLVWMSLFGFFTDSSIRYLDTSLVGAITVRITLAGNEILTCVGNSGGGSALGHVLTTQEKGLPLPTYTISELYSTIDVLSMPEVYSRLVRDRMSSAGSIALNFKDYLTYSLPGQAGDTAQIQFNLSSQSLDRVYVVMRPEDYNSTTPKSGFAFDTTAVSFGDTNYSSFFQFKSFDSTVDRDGTASYQWQINNVPAPQYRMKTSDAIFNLPYSEDVSCWGG